MTPSEPPGLSNCSHSCKNIRKLANTSPPSTLANFATLAMRLKRAAHKSRGRTARHPDSEATGTCQVAVCAIAVISPIEKKTGNNESFPRTRFWNGIRSRLISELKWRGTLLQSGALSARPNSPASPGFVDTIASSMGTTTSRRLAFSCFKSRTQCAACSKTKRRKCHRRRR